MIRIGNYMRTVPYADQKWIFGDNHQLLGLRFGVGHDRVHEMGMDRLLNAFVPFRDDGMGLERYRSQVLPEGFQWVSTESYEGVAYLTEPDSNSLIEEYMAKAPEGEPVIAWNAGNFLVVASKQGDDRYRKAVSALWEAFHQKDVYLGGPFGERFAGLGVGLFIVSTMPEDNLYSAHKSLLINKKTNRRLRKGMRRDGFWKIRKKLAKKGKEWLCLEPLAVAEDGSVSYWLETAHGGDRFIGPVTILDLKDWLKGIGSLFPGAV